MISKVELQGLRVNVKRTLKRAYKFRKLDLSYREASNILKATNNKSHVVKSCLKVAYR